MGKTSDRRNRIYFRIISWFLVLLFFALIEIVLRLFSYGSDVHLFVKPLSESKSDYLKVNPDVGEKYFTRFEATSGTNDMFLKQKPDDGFRIFLLGSSTLYGYPYGTNLMASRILHKRLQDAYPDRTIEVVNTSITAINSYTLKDYIPQVLKYEPDAVLIYAGHNEYYGAFGVGSNERLSKYTWIMSAHFKLMNLRVYQLMRSAIGGASGRFTGGQDSQEKGTLMKRIVRDEEIVFQGEKYLAGMDQFRNNMSFILKKAGKKGVPVFISELVGNVRDLPPFGSEGTGKDNAEQVYEEALKTLSGGDTLMARSLFYRAKDLDPIRFRASEELNHLIGELAGDYDAHLIPAKEWFSSSSEGALIGNNLLTEHVHPNIDGQFLLADVFYTSIVSSGLIHGQADAHDSRSAEYYRRNWAYTELDSLMAIYQIENLKSDWPFAPLENEVSFRDTFQVHGIMDSLAFSILTDPEANIRTIHLNYAEFLEDEGELSRALKEYEALIYMNPYFSEYFNRAANCLLKMNDLYAAENYLLESVRYGENYFAFSLLAELETIKQNYSGAISYYNKALELAEGNRGEEEEDLKILISDIRRKLTDLKKQADRPLDGRNFPYLNYIPQDIEGIYTRAISILESDMDSARILFQECLKINDCPLVNFQIGNILYKQRDLQALDFYNKAYDAFASDPNFLVRYCVVNKLGGNREKALGIYNELLKISPGHPELSNLKKTLDK